MISEIEPIAAQILGAYACRRSKLPLESINPEDPTTRSSYGSRYSKRTAERYQNNAPALAELARAGLCQKVDVKNSDPSRHPRSLRLGYPDQLRRSDP